MGGHLWEEPQHQNHGVQDLLKQRPQRSFSHAENAQRSAVLAHFEVRKHHANKHGFGGCSGWKTGGCWRLHGASTALERFARTWVFQTVGDQISYQLWLHDC